MTKRDGCLCVAVSSIASLVWFIIPWFDWRVLLMAVMAIVATFLALLIVRPRINDKEFYSRMLVGYLVGAVVFLWVGNLWGVRKVLSIIGSLTMHVPFCAGMMIRYDCVYYNSKNPTKDRGENNET